MAFMVQVTLPDGSRREFPGPVTIDEVAQSIGAGLARAAVARRVKPKGAEQPSRLVDTSYVIEDDIDPEIVTAKDSVGLEILRNSTAHMMAYMVKELFHDSQESN